MKGNTPTTKPAAVQASSRRLSPPTSRRSAQRVPTKTGKTKSKLYTPNPATTPNIPHVQAPPAVLLGSRANRAASKIAKLPKVSTSGKPFMASAEEANRSGGPRRNKSDLTRESGYFPPSVSG